MEYWGPMDEKLRLSVENLILNNGISIVAKLEETTTLFFFKRHVRRYYLMLNNAEVLNDNQGFLEQIIVAQVTTSGEIQLREFLRNVLDQLLGSNETFINPGKAILAILIEQHQKSFLTYQYKSAAFFRGRQMIIELHIPTAAKQLLYSIQTNISIELNRNNEFLEFNARLIREIERALSRKRDSS